MILQSTHFAITAGAVLAIVGAGCSGDGGRPLGDLEQVVCAEQLEHGSVLVGPHVLTFPDCT